MKTAINLSRGQGVNDVTREKMQKYISFIVADISAVLYGRDDKAISNKSRECRPDYTSFPGIGRE